MTTEAEADCEVRQRKSIESRPISVERSADGWASQGDERSSRTVRELIWSELVNEAKQDLLKDFNERLDTVLDNLVGQVSRKESVLQEEQPGSTWMLDKKRYPRDKPPEKVFEMRHSVLTNLFQVNHIRTVYHLFITMLIIFVTNTVIQDSLEQQTLLHFHHWEFFLFTLGGFKEIVLCWLAMKMSTILVPFNGFLLWRNFRVNLKLSPFKVCLFDGITIAGYICYLMVFFLMPLRYILLLHMPPVGSFIVLIENVRMTMKSHAFIRSAAGNFISSLQQAESDKAASGSSQQSDSTLLNIPQKPSLWEPNFSQYLYFLFAPTLLYRDSYPKTASIRWTYVASNLAQVVGCVVFCYYLFFRFCFTIFSVIGKTPEFTFQSYILASTACSLPGGLVMLLAFFASLHSWLNAFAEMLRFGDRLFYKDWWNASTFSTWYRTWNVVVYDWLYTYVHRDLILWKSSKARGLATFTVFFLSAAIHEYILAVTLGFIYPVLFCFFFVFGYAFYCVKGSGRGWNVAIWIMLFVGWGQMMCLYSMEWYARINCQPVLNSWLNYVTPHSWFCTSKHY